ncbi:MAG TPA: hypothetical protein VJB14_18425 [Planctomycetota bacterium]|nr:hypothetical protein [Planctomycetota bacterium]
MAKRKSPRRPPRRKPRPTWFEELRDLERGIQALRRGLPPEARARLQWNSQDS